MKFRPYQSLGRYGTQETEGITNGKCYIFPKLDGTNASTWLDNDPEKGLVLQAGSRRRLLNETSDGDNAGFCKYVHADENLFKLLMHHPDLRLYGEWLVPHSLKTYQNDAWKKFYVFDVVREDPHGNEDSHFTYLPYEEYKEILDQFNVNYIPPIAVIENATIENIYTSLEHNQFLIKDGEGNGEGVVIKNYDYINRFGRQIWAKLITNEFKEKRTRTMGVTEITNLPVEEKMVEDFLTEEMIRKEYSKILQTGEWTQKMIPRLLSTVFYCYVTEELWEALKKFKNPIVDFKRLNYFCNKKVKEVMTELF